MIIELQTGNGTVTVTRLTEREVQIYHQGIRDAFAAIQNALGETDYVMDDAWSQLQEVGLLPAEEQP